MPTVVVSSYNVASFPEGGGHFWVYMQYLQALRMAGCDVWWIEQFDPGASPDAGRSQAATFFQRAHAFGFEGKALLYAPDGDGTMRVWPDGGTRLVENALKRADLLLNFHYAIDPRLLAIPKRTALVDIDPGLLQCWIEAGQLTVSPHDVYFTIGEMVSGSVGPTAAANVDWIHLYPPICLDHWPRCSDSTCEAFTTVSGWSADTWMPVMEDGRQVLRENTKRVSFLEFVDLPRRTAQVMELALDLAETDLEERRLLERRGWRVRHARDVAGSPERYRAYIQRSRGEFSCAKPFYVRLQSAWVSDRTLCYLASGKPVVVQHTGPSAYLPHGEGMFRFTSMAEATEAIETINDDYERHCRAARDIAETYFDSDQVAERILGAALT